MIWNLLKINYYMFMVSHKIFKYGVNIGGEYHDVVKQAKIILCCLRQDCVRNAIFWN